KATLPPDVAQKLTKGVTGTPKPGQSPFLPAIIKLPTATPAGGPSGTPAGKIAGKPLSLPTATTSPAGSPITGQSPPGGKGLHPGAKFTPLVGQSPTTTPAGAPTGTPAG